MEEIPLTPEIIEFFQGYEKSAEDVYLSSLDEPQRERIRDALDSALCNLSDREMVVIGFSFFLRLSNYRIAKTLGLSREGVGKLRTTFFEELKKS